jgi:hypothetical protein
MSGALQNKYVRRLQAVIKAAGPEGIIAPREHEKLRKLHGVAWGAARAEQPGGLLEGHRR